MPVAPISAPLLTQWQPGSSGPYGGPPQPPTPAWQPAAMPGGWAADLSNLWNRSQLFSRRGFGRFDVGALTDPSYLKGAGLQRYLSPDELGGLLLDHNPIAFGEGERTGLQGWLSEAYAPFYSDYMAAGGQGLYGYSAPVYTPPASPEAQALGPPLGLRAIQQPGRGGGYSVEGPQRKGDRGTGDDPLYAALDELGALLGDVGIQNETYAADLAALQAELDQSKSDSAQQNAILMALLSGGGQQDEYGGGSYYFGQPIYPGGGGLFG